MEGPTANFMRVSRDSGLSDVLALTFILFCRLNPLSHATLVTGSQSAILQNLDISG